MTLYARLLATLEVQPNNKAEQRAIKYIVLKCTDCLLEVMENYPHHKLKSKSEQVLIMFGAAIALLHKDPHFKNYTDMLKRDRSLNEYQVIERIITEVLGTHV